MNITYVHQWCGTDECNGFTFVGAMSPMNIRGVPCDSRPRPHGPYVHRLTNEHRNYIRRFTDKPELTNIFLIFLYNAHFDSLLAGSLQYKHN
jgi:hypothetical protein